ncbi:hypothetical protein Tco_1300940 [Tanacetum coccineum]
MTESPLEDSGFAVPVFSSRDDLIACLNNAMTFLTLIASSRFPSTNTQLKNSSNPRNQATVQDDKSQCNKFRETRQCTQPKKPRNATWYKDKAMLTEAQEAGKILDEEQLAFLADPGGPDGQAVHTIIPNNAVFRLRILILMILTMMISRMQKRFSWVTFPTMVLTLSQREKLALKEQVDSLEQNLSKQIKEKECLLQTFTVFKNESKEKEDKYMENEIDLEKKIKELDNILFKVGQSAQTMHMLTKPQAFYDNIHKQALGYQNPFHLKKAQRIKPTLYDGIVILSDDFGKRFIPQQELSAEQAFWLRMSNPTSKPSDALPVIIEAPKELPKISLVNESLKKLKFHLAKFNNVVKIRTTPDTRTEDEWGHEKMIDSQMDDMIREKLALKEQVDSLEQNLSKQLKNNNFFTNNDLKAQLQDKDNTICKLKDIIKSMREKSKEENVKYDYCEIETKNVELENKQFDSIKRIRVHSKEWSDSLIDKLNLKSVENEDLKAQIQDKVESLKTLDSNTPVSSSTGLKYSTSKCGSKPTSNKRNDRISQTPSRNMKNKVEAQPRKFNKKYCVVKPIHDVDKHSLLNANSEPICATCKKSLFDGVYDMCFLKFVKNVNSCAKSAKITLANVVPPKKTTSHSVETQKPELKVIAETKNVKIKLLNIENQSPADDEIASLLETSARHATGIPKITSDFTTTTPPPPPQTSQFVEAVSSIPGIVDTYLTFKMKEAVDVDSTIKAIIKDQVKAQVSKIMPKIKKVYLSEFELKKILIEKMEANKSIDRSDIQKNLYNALVESYNNDNDIMSSYGDVAILKRGRHDKDKDEDPSAGSDRGTKRRKSGKDAESFKDSRSKEKKSSSTFKDASQSQHKSSDKSAHAEEPSHTIEDSDMQQDQEFVTGDNDEQPTDKEVKYDQHAYLATSHWGPKHQRFYGYASNLTSSKDVYSRRRIIAVTKLRIMKMYDYGHLEEIEVRRDDQKLYTFKEGDFKRLRLQDTEDMLFLLVQQKLTNLTIDKRYDINVALCMYTRWIVIQKRVEDLQLGFKRKRLLRTDELHKFSDGTFNDVRTALHDIVAGIRIEYLPMRKWSDLDKKRAWVMVQDIDKHLYQRRLIRNLEKFIVGETVTHWFTHTVLAALRCSGNENGLYRCETLSRRFFRILSDHRYSQWRQQLDVDVSDS